MKLLSSKAKLELIRRVRRGEKIAKICREVGIARKTFYVWLKKYQCVKPNLVHNALCDKRFKRGVGYRLLASYDRLLLINKGLYKEASIAQLCRNFGVSRKTFYKWLRRYQAQGEAGLSDSRKRGEAHHRTISPVVKEQILEAVVQNPAYSVHKLHQELSGVVGHHGVQNILEREGLNTFAKRLVFAQGYISQPKVTVAPLYEPTIPLFRLRQILAPFVTVPKLIAKKPRAGIFTTLLLLIPFFILYLFVKLLITAPLGVASLGLIFAAIALVFGLFFFIYSLKYYLGVLLVLRLSQSIGSRRGREDLEGMEGTKRRANSLLIDLEKVELSAERPFVSIHLAVYNEKKVIERLIEACTSQNWFCKENTDTGSEKINDPVSEDANYEVVIVDDSTDETTELALQVLRDNYGELREMRGDEGEKIYKTSPNPDKPSLTLIHRASRAGFKGGALQSALENTDPRAEYVCVFDSDFVPYPDTIEQFVKTFQVLNANEMRMGNARIDANISIDSQNLNSQTDSHSNIAAVQGYQWHVLNKSENWITRGVRTEYAGSYVIERASEEIYGGLKQIAGSVYAIRADILREFGWGKSITEDFELTLRLYEQGYKVAFTPYIQAPAEAVSTIRRLIRQRMRWAEGASYNIKLMFSRMLWGHWESASSDNTRNRPIATLLNCSIVKENSGQQSSNETMEQSAKTNIKNGKIWVSSKLTLAEKLEFAYLAPYYLQAAFFVIGTLSWFISEAIFKTHLPFWTAALGWSLVFSNLLSLPLMNITGLFLEESDERDYLGILSFIALSYIMVPFQAYAAVKGFLEKEEGPWFRTPKTGVITDVIQKARFYRWFGKFWLGGRKPIVTPTFSPAPILATANRQFSSFYISKRKKIGPLVNGIILSLFLFSLTLGYLSPLIPERKEVSAQGDVGALNILKPGQAEAAGEKTKKGEENTTQQTQKLPAQLDQDLNWGVLAINFDQSIYLPNQKVKIDFSVLDEKGLADCNASLELGIKEPDGKTTILSSQNQKIQKSQNCGILEATSEPDYFAAYTPSSVGAYEAKFTATKSNDPVSLGQSRTIVDHFYVEKEPEMVIKRLGPTRLYPANRYTMELEVIVQKNFVGILKETLPLSFDLIAEEGMTLSQEENRKVISWQKNLIAGVTYKFSYEFQGPQESPQFYLLGPLKFSSQFTVDSSQKGLEGNSETAVNREPLTDNGFVFTEARAWQIANDVQYNCTWNSTTGTWETAAKWSNCNSTYPNNGGGNTYTATINNTSAAVTTGTTAVTIDSLAIGSSITSSLTLSFNLTVGGNVTIGSSGTVSAGATTMTVGGSWSNSGTFTAGTSTVVFNDTSGDGAETISGTLNGSSAFYKVNFNGSGGAWTIQNPMLVSAANATDTLGVTAGTVTLGDGGGDNLDVRGKFTVSSGATFQTINGLAQGDSTACNSDDICIDINANSSPPSCTNCIISVSGNLYIYENVTVRLNSNASVESGIEVASTGYLAIQGNQDDTGTSNGTTNETTITDTTKAWSTNQHQYKVVRITNTSSLAFGKIYDISSNTATALTRADSSSATDTNPDVTGGTACSGSGACTINVADTLISANDEGIGRYLHNLTDDKWYRIVDSAEAAQDTITIVSGVPDVFTTMGDGDDIEISDGVRINDQYEILDYAVISAQAGTSCNDTENGYIYLQSNSETLIRYADICDLGANVWNKYGIFASGVNGFDASEGLTIEKSRIHDGYDGINFSSSSNNNSTNSKGVSNSAVYNNSREGIYFNSNSDNNTISYNNTYSNQYNIWIQSSTRNVVSYNIVYKTTQYCNITLYTSNNNIVYSNTSYQGGNYGIDISNSASQNIVSTNTFFSNISSEIDFFATSNNNILYNNDAYSSVRDAVYFYNSTGNIGVAEDYGVLASNTLEDVNFTTSDASNFRCYSCNLASTTEASGITYAGSYLASFKHDTTGGSTKIWGEYAIPDNNTETPNDEGTNKFNYVNNLWEDSFADPGYSGTGTQDTNLNLAFNGGSLGGSNAGYVYRIVCKNTNCVTSPTSAWDVFRDEVDVGDASTGSTYTDSTNVQFKIDDAGTDFAQGDTYTFVVWRNSSDANNSQKTITMMQDGDSFTAGTGETLELKGQAAGSNLTQVSRGVSGGYNFSISGTIDAQYYSYNYLGGTGGANGLALNSGATVTSISYGTFDNFSSTGGATDAFITVDTSLIGTGAPSKTITGLSLTNTGSGADYNIKASGSSVSGHWLFSSWTGAFGGEVYDYDVAPGDEIVWEVAALGDFESSNSNATAYSWQRKTFYESTNGVYWTFYYDGSQIVYYYSSNDGTSWTSGGTLSHNTNDFSVWHSGTTIYLAFTDSANYDISVRKGTLGASSITWDTTSCTSGVCIALSGTGSSDTYAYPFINMSSGSYLWVTGRYYNGTNYYVKAVRSTNTNNFTAWDTPSDLSDTANTNANVFSVIVSLGFLNQMYAIWVKGTAIEGQQYTTFGWAGSATSIGTSYSASTAYNISAVVKTGSPIRIHLIYPNSSGYVIYDQWDTNDQDWAVFSDVTLDSGGVNSYLTLSLNTSNSDLYALWVRSNTIYYKKGVSPYASANWDSSATSWKTGTSPAHVSSNYSGAGRIFATWTEGSSSPYSILWDYVIVPEKLLALLGIGPLLPLFLRKMRQKKRGRKHK